MAKKQKKPSPPPRVLPSAYEGEDEFIFGYKEHLDLLFQLGLICARWSELEMFLAHMYVLLVFGARDQVDQAEITITEAFEQLPTWNTKTKLLKAAAERRLGSELGAELSRLLGSFESIQQRRNNAVHGRWAKPKIEDSKGKVVRYKTMVGPKDLWDAKVFGQLHQDIREAFNLLFEFTNKARERLKGERYLSSLADLMRLTAEQNSLDTVEG